MSERDAEIVRRYATGAETFTAIGKAFGLSAERIRQIVYKAERLAGRAAIATLGGRVTPHGWFVSIPSDGRLSI
jgi:hypothetical protein